MEIDEDNDFDAQNNKSRKSQVKEKKPDELLQTPPRKSQNQDLNADNNITPFKLEVSESEDDFDDEEFVSIKEKQIFDEKIRILKQNLQDSGDKVFLLRNGLPSISPDEFVLGFDENSGEAEITKDKTFALQFMINIGEKESQNIMNEIQSTEFNDFPTPTTNNTNTTPTSSSPKEADMGTQEQTTTAPSNPIKNIDKETKNNPKDFKNVVPPRKHIVGDADVEDEDDLHQPQAAKLKVLENASAPSHFKKPFEHGWRREVVWRIHSSGKEKADIYFISPTGKKVRSRNELMPVLANNEHGLTLENFSFAREPLGLGEQFEVVRQAKNLTRSSLSLPSADDNASSPTAMGKRISKPKVPKGASPPPEGWTATKAIKMNNTALQTGRNPSPSLPNESTTIKKSSSQQSASSSSRSSKSKRPSSSHHPEKASSSSSVGKKIDMCNGKCVRPQQGSSIQIQCKICSKVFHPQCVGLKLDALEYNTMSGNNAKNDPNKKDYLCETCLPSPSPQKVNSANSLDKREQKRKEEKNKNNSIMDGNATSSTSTVATPPALPPPEIDVKFPQSLAVVKGKKYVMVSKAINTNDAESEKELKMRMAKTIRNIRQARSANESGVGNIPIIPSMINSNQQFAANFFSNLSDGYTALINVLKYLKIHERARAASVCKLWYLATKDPIFWRIVRMKNSKVYDWGGLAAALRRGETKQLDLRKVLFTPGSRTEEAWRGFIDQIGTVYTLEHIDMCRCPSKVVETLFHSNRNLRILNALDINDNNLDLHHLGGMKYLTELRLRFHDTGLLKTGLQPLANLKRIRCLVLSGVKPLHNQGLEVLGELKTLISLEIGECGEFDENFAKVILPKMKSLRRLRMENNQYETCDTLLIVKTVAKMKLIEHLELVNFDIKPGFETEIANCKQLKKLLIIPTYISQSATTNNVVLSSVQKVNKFLKVFIWGVTNELLRVTALYVDQCDHVKQDRQKFDECIPVLKPVPGANTFLDEFSEETAQNENIENIDQNESGENNEHQVPQIEILPLDRIETILATNLPNTNYHIVKIPYQSTCKQHIAI